MEKFAVASLAALRSALRCPTRSGWNLAIAVACGTSLLSNPAQAGNAKTNTAKKPPIPVEDERTREIVVTATRRAERLQDVPATITALDQNDIERTGITTLDQVAERSPGFSVTKLGDTRPRLYIRGVGTREYDPGSESSVGVFVDDMYIGRLSSVFSSLQDIARIEVLKGPQTTLYGQNTIGGAINIVSKLPTDDLEIEARGGVGNFRSSELFAAVSGPLGNDKILGRIMAYRSISDGYVTNLTTGHHSQGRDDWGGRARLLFRPFDKLRVLLTAETFRGDGPSVDAKSVGSPTDAGGTFFSASTVGVPGAPRPAQIADRFADFYNRDSKLRRNTDSAIGKFDYETSIGTLTGISSFRESAIFETRDFDATSLDSVNLTISERSRQTTMELRLASNKEGPLFLDGRLRWIVGGFYYGAHTQRTDRFDFGVASVSAVRTGSPQNDKFQGEFRTRSGAIYGEATYFLTPRLSLTAGLRYTRYRKSLVQTDTASRPGAGFIAANFKTPVVHRDDSAWTPKLVLSYKFLDNILGYASFNRGFKGGGFQYIPTKIAAARATFRPEKSDAYEVGLKSRFWDGKATLDIAAFYYDDRDLQVQRSSTLVDGTIAIVTNNAERSTISGIEVNATVSPVRGLHLEAAYSLVKAKYDRYLSNAPGQPASTATDYSGTPIIRSPKNSFALAAEYEVRINPNLSLSPRIAWTYRSKFFFEPGGGDPRFGAAIPLTRQTGFGLVNISLIAAIGSFKIRAYADNVLDQYYRVDAQKLPFNYIVNYPGQPRTYGISTSFKI